MKGYSFNWLKCALTTTLVILVAVFHGQTAVAQTNLDALIDADWKLKKDKKAIQVYTTKVKGSAYAAVKVEAVVSGLRLASLVALIEDADACSDWADQCAESYVHQRVSDTEAYVYTHNDMPFPVKDRDVLAHLTWTQSPDSLVVVMKSNATTGILAEKKGRKRLAEASAQWRFVPLDFGQVRITNIVHINPGSNLPGWVTNMLLVETPHSTMQSFVDAAQKPKYRDAVVSFVTEPAI